MNGLELNIVLGNYVDWIKRDWLYSPRLGPTIKSNLFYGVSPTKRADQTSQVVDFTANSIHFNIVESNLIGSKQQRLSCIFFRKKIDAMGFLYFFDRWILFMLLSLFRTTHRGKGGRGRRQRERVGGVGVGAGIGVSPLLRTGRVDGQRFRDFRICSVDQSCFYLLCLFNI